ncbi:unnamed protein product [Trichogramma brassicae]|uniref:Uncharacterized protein n=1 Tax=Trichogramma brassicae TaxID=86971 RepID=A0A6H5IUC9_9HYME|nr:unnamed protein product [Trichogramma brassicae]
MESDGLFNSAIRSLSPSNHSYPAFVFIMYAAARLIDDRHVGRPAAAAADDDRGTRCFIHRVSALYIYPSTKRSSGINGLEVIRDVCCRCCCCCCDAKLRGVCTRMARRRGIFSRFSGHKNHVSSL